MSPGFGIYVHWPFCLSKCPYCDFNSHVSDAIDQARWRAGLLRELDHFAAETRGRTVTSLFFGGGTPSLMDPVTTGAIIGRVAELWDVAPDLEVTLEANPGTVDYERFTAFREAGVNRLSMGIQALNDADLKFLGRRHNLDEALRAIDIAARTFDRYSFDLIYARPGQTVAAWEAELGRALAMAGDHLSLYQLTIEPGTAFYPLFSRGEHKLPDEEVAAELFELTQSMCEAAGLPAYEVSNHARPGSECRHNLLYWQGGDYVGIGPGAHGRLTGAAGPQATRQHRAPDIWLARVEEQGHATQEREPLDATQRAEELVMMGLRLRDGIDLALFRRIAGRDLADLLDPRGVARMVEGGFVTLDAATLRATPAGRLVLNGVLGELLA